MKKTYVGVMIWVSGQKSLSKRTNTQELKPIKVLNKIIAKRNGM